MRINSYLIRKAPGPEKGSGIPCEERKNLT